MCIRDRLLFCTVGILLRRLQSDPALGGVTHVILDEVHERAIMTDFALAILKDLLTTRPELRLVLMSATVDAAPFGEYFGKVLPVVEAPAVQHHVDVVWGDALTELTGAAPEGEPRHGGAKGKGGDGSKGAGKGKKENSSSKAKSSKGKGSKGPDEARFKNDLCKQFGTKRGCVYGDKCHFAHGKGELIARSPGTGKGTSTGKGGKGASTGKGGKGASTGKGKSTGSNKLASIDYNLLTEVVQHIMKSSDPSGAVLVFVPGLAEIKRVCTEVEKNLSKRVWMIPLHSSISNQEQRQAFRSPPTGLRKIVVATNIAEASITIPDVCHVIDTGRVKEMRLDADRNMSCLKELYVSRASAQQRKGRAGRVRDGTVYRLYSQQTHDDTFEAFSKPEMQCAPLQELVLQVKLLELGAPVEFLAKCMSPPPPTAVAHAVQTLTAIGALTAPPQPAPRRGRNGGPVRRTPIQFMDGELTPLGFHIASLSCDARVGKMLLMGALFGCAEQVLTMAAALSCKTPFVTPLSKQEEADRAKRKFSSSGSDHIAVLRVFDEYCELERAAVSYTHLRAHETVLDLVCRLLLEKKNKTKTTITSDQ
eukprot:TRINITY_DN19928_c0_g1_i1.p1 TRINITY_DN19928_c0_g1~~TRINITY_DN19928_c0_g1_i1.p1  ORF type:complete len:592 (+),score=128.96 TRINITY_DN19928_c0_g1_i1:79-1854(+)